MVRLIRLNSELYILVLVSLLRIGAALGQIKNPKLMQMLPIRNRAISISKLPKDLLVFCEHHSHVRKCTC